MKEDILQGTNMDYVCLGWNGTGSVWTSHLGATDLTFSSLKGEVALILVQGPQGRPISVKGLVVVVHKRLQSRQGVCVSKSYRDGGNPVLCRHILLKLLSWHLFRCL